MQPQLRPTTQPPPPAGCTGNAPPGGATGVPRTVGVNVTLDEALAEVV
ncbi:hypothetical protein [Mycobacterium sp.]|nr:hypothetical protein [Mycobacterium sp.]HTQ22687.1 hypothetical protein [Mycobacterium sp.]